MFVDLSRVSIIFVRPGITDMRKQITGLAGIVERDLGGDPFSGSLYLFCNRNRKLLKVLYWERNGFCLWYKRLERDKFPWPSDGNDARKITLEQLSMLLDGIDFWHAHKRCEYKVV